MTSNVLAGLGALLIVVSLMFLAGVFIAMFAAGAFLLGMAWVSYQWEAAEVEADDEEMEP